MKYLCLVYVEESVIDALPKDEYERLRSESMAHLKELRARGLSIVAQRLERVSTATSMRRRNGKLMITDGPFAETKEQLGGFLLVETADPHEARRVAAGMPIARLGSIEVRPIWELAQKQPSAGRALPAQAVGG